MSESPPDAPSGPAVGLGTVRRALIVSRTPREQAEQNLLRFLIETIDEAREHTGSIDAGLGQLLHLVCGNARRDPVWTADQFVSVGTAVRPPGQCAL
ncbi:hypothetical protein Airi02_104860 [Actinoallomurus iriomotensis]|uniref:Uncharacterized protein n=1 Tax=Actinoallomurus iriomotensis TaxID=478107 RepID=A0A9W6W0P8_9ACTN|nr:hypothetical protein Airi02_104860 [Actinoallomurus iriomotensis]